MFWCNNDVMITLCVCINHHMARKVWDEFTYLFPKRQRLQSWSLGMDKKVHPTLHSGYSYLCILGLKLIHISKRRHGAIRFRDILVPLLPTKAYVHACTYFHGKGIFFQWEKQIHEIKKRGNFWGINLRNFGKGYKFCIYLTVFIRVFIWSKQRSGPRSYA